MTQAPSEGKAVLAVSTPVVDAWKRETNDLGHVNWFFKGGGRSGKMLLLRSDDGQNFFPVGHSTNARWTGVIVGDGSPKTNRVWRLYFPAP